MIHPENSVNDKMHNQSIIKIYTAVLIAKILSNHNTFILIFSPGLKRINGKTRNESLQKRLQSQF